MQLLCSRSTTSVAYQSSFLLVACLLEDPLVSLMSTALSLPPFQTSSLKALQWFVNGSSAPQLSLGTIGGWLLAMRIFSLILIHRV
jgi:hypothetical protein